MKTKSKKRDSRKDLTLTTMMILFIVFSYLLFDKFFAQEMPDYATNIIAAVIGTVMTIALMMLLMQYQVKAEEQKEFKTILFEKKLEIYNEFLETIFKMDDDNMIDKEEVQTIENLMSKIALVAGRDLVEVCSTFVVQLKSYGVLYTRSMVSQQLAHYVANCGPVESFISLDDLMQSFRDDVSVVAGDVSDLLERFVGIQYDQYHMIKDPNNVD